MMPIPAGRDLASVCGLYAIVAKAWSPSPNFLAIGGHGLFSWSPFLGGMIGAVYGAFVEIDDASGEDARALARLRPRRRRNSSRSSWLIGLPGSHSSRVRHG